MSAAIWLLAAALFIAASTLAIDGAPQQGRREWSGFAALKSRTGGDILLRATEIVAFFDCDGGARVALRGDADTYFVSQTALQVASAIVDAEAW